MSSTHSSNPSKPLASLSQSYHGKTGHSAAVSPQRSTLLSVFRSQKMPPSKRLEETLAEVSSNAEMHMIPPLRRVDPTGAAKGESARRSFYTTLPVVTDVYQDRLTETGSSGRPSFLYCQKPNVLPSYKEATTLDLAECVGVGIPVQTLAGPPEFMQTPAKDHDAKETLQRYNVLTQESEVLPLSSTIEPDEPFEPRSNVTVHARKVLSIDQSIPPKNGLPKPYEDVKDHYRLHQKYLAALYMPDDIPPATNRKKAFDSFLDAFRAVAVPYAKALVDDLLASKINPRTGLAYHNGIVFKVNLGNASYDDVISSREARNKIASLDLKGCRHMEAAQAARDGTRADFITVPFHMVISYCGVAVLCSTLTPISEGNLCHGMTGPDNFVINSDPNFSLSIQLCAAALRLKPHPGISAKKGDSTEFILPFDAMGYRSKLDNRLYVHHLARLLPPVYPRHQNKKNEYLYELFRPELIKMLPPNIVIADACSNFAMPEWEIPIRVASRCLLRQALPTAAKDMVTDLREEAVHIDELRANGLINFLHNNGINVRYLHVFLQHLEALTPSVHSTAAIDVVRTEMIARACKRVMNNIRQGVSKDQLTLVEFIRRFMLSKGMEDIWVRMIAPVLVEMFDPQQGYSDFHIRDVDKVHVLTRACKLCGVEIRCKKEGKPMGTRYALQSLDLIDDCIVLPLLKYNFLPPSPYPEGEQRFHVSLAQGFIQRILRNNIRTHSVLHIGRHCTDYLRNTSEECQELALWDAYTKDLVQETRKNDNVTDSPSYLFKYRAVKSEKGSEKTYLGSFDVSAEACKNFGFYAGQRVIHTLGAKRGVASTIIGVGLSDKLLYRHDDDYIGAIPCSACDKFELMLEFGFVLFMSVRLRDLEAFSNSDSLAWRPMKPFCYINPTGIPMFLDSHSFSLKLFGFSTGDHVLFTKGESRGKTAVILGIFDNKLWYHPDGDGFPRCFEERDGVAIQERYGPLVLYALPNFAQYPLTGNVSYGLRDIQASHKAMLTLGFFHRQRICATAGAMMGITMTILGIRNSLLQVILEHNQEIVELAGGYSRQALIGMYNPEVIGMTTHPLVPLPTSPRFRYTTKAGKEGEFDARCSSCAAYGAVHRQRVKVIQGEHVNTIGTVIGVLQERLHVSLDNHEGTVAVSQQDFVILNVPVKDVHVQRAMAANSRWKGVKNHLTVVTGVVALMSGDVRLRQEKEAPKKEPPNPYSSIDFLTEFGEVVTFDIRPSECRRFNLFHGQRLILRYHKLCTVVGLYADEIWCVYDGESFARPMAGSCYSVLRARWQPQVIGMKPLVPFFDALMVANTTITMSTASESYTKPGILPFPTEKYGLVGFDTSKGCIATFLPQTSHGVGIQREDNVHSQQRRGIWERVVVGPCGIVIGVFQNKVWVQFDGEKVASPIPEGQLHKWKVLDPKRVKEIQEAATPKPFRFYIERVILRERLTAKISGYQWSSKLRPFSREENEAIENFRLAASERFTTTSTVLLSDGSRVSLYNNKHITTNRELYDLHSIPVYDLGAKVATMVPFSVESVSPGVLESHSSALTKKWEKLKKRKPLFLVSTFTEGKPREVYTADELDLLSPAVDYLMTFVTRDLLKLARIRGQTSLGKEVRACLQPFPIGQYAALLKHMLSAVHVIVDEVLGANLLSEILVVLEEKCKFHLETPLMEEWCDYLSAEMIKISKEEEPKARADLSNTEKGEWETLKLTYEGSKNLVGPSILSPRQKVAAERIGVLHDDIDELHHKVAARVEIGRVNETKAPSPHHLKVQNLTKQKQSAPLEGNSVIQELFKYITDIGTVLFFTDNANTRKKFGFGRGDIVEYHKGDLVGVTGTILGEYNNELWRYDHNVAWTGKAAAFRGGKENIEHLHGLTLARKGSTRDGHPRSQDDFRYLRYDGLVMMMQVSDEVVEPFGARHGERYRTTKDTRDFPFPSSQLVTIIGVYEGLLYFAMDNCGAIPFKTPFETLPMRLCYCTTVTPLHTVSNYVICRALLSASDALSTYLNLKEPTDIVLEVRDETLTPYNVKSRMLLETSRGSGSIKFHVVGVRQGELYILQNNASYASVISPLNTRFTMVKDSNIIPMLRDLVMTHHEQHGVLLRHLCAGAIGGVYLFDVSYAKCQVFGFSKGDKLQLQLPCVEAGKVVTVIGVRAGMLWFVEEGRNEREAIAFSGCKDLGSIMRHYNPKKLEGLANVLEFTG